MQMQKEQKYISNIEYLNIAQMKSLHRIEIKRLRAMIERYEKVSPRLRDNISVLQLGEAINHQKAMLNEITSYIEKLENFFTKR